MANLPAKSGARTRDIRNRLRLFRAGAWDMLFTKANADPPPPPLRSDSARSALQSDDARSAKMADKAMKLGSVRMAAAALANPNLGVVTDMAAAEATFRAVLPEPSGPAPDLPLVSEEVREALGPVAVGPELSSAHPQPAPGPVQRHPCP